MRKCSLCLGSSTVSKSNGVLAACPACSGIKINTPAPVVKETIVETKKVKEEVKVVEEEPTITFRRKPKKRESK